MLEDYVIDATVAMLKQNSFITRLAKTIVKVHKKLVKDNSGLQILIKKRDETKRAADNIVKAIEQGIIMDFTKDRLSALQAELNGLEIEINKETQKSYAHLTVEEVEKYLLTKVFEDPNDIKTRKLLVNTFIREIIWYENKLVITYNFHENAIPERPTKSHIEDIEKQIKEASRSAFSFTMGSHKFQHSVPSQAQGVICSTPQKFVGCSRMRLRLLFASQKYGRSPRSSFLPHAKNHRFFPRAPDITLLRNYRVAL